MKVQLENITLQMYRDGTGYSEAVCEFQSYIRSLVEV